MREQRRVSLVGAHGTGKSTLGPLIVAAMNGIYGGDWRFIPEIAREVLKEKEVTENLGGLPVEKIIEIQTEILSRKQAKRSISQDFVEDRHPIIDVYAYSTYWLARHPSAETFLDEIRSKIRTVSDANHSDVLVVVPPNIPHHRDGVRAETFHFRQTVHYITLGILEEYKYNYHVLETGPLHERLEEVLEIVRMYG